MLVTGRKMRPIGGNTMHGALARPWRPWEVRAPSIGSGSYRRPPAAVPASPTTPVATGQEALSVPEFGFAALVRGDDEDPRGCTRSAANLSYLGRRSLGGWPTHLRDQPRRRHSAAQNGREIARCRRWRKTNPLSTCARRRGVKSGPTLTARLLRQRRRRITRRESDRR